MKFQILSDLHLELKKEVNFELKKTAPNIILAGDIGNPFSNIYSEFIDFLANNYNLVILITGNHEYYLNDITETNNKITELVSKYTNVHFLNNSVYINDEENIKIIGTTLWSYISLDEYYAAFKYINDYKNIRYNNTQLAPYNTNDFYEKNKKFIMDNIDNKYKNIVVTHYLPTYKLIHDKYISHPLNCCFASNLDDIIKPPINLWVCGHSHQFNEIEINNVKCVLNPVGYERENTNYKNDYSIEI